MSKGDNVTTSDDLCRCICHSEGIDVKHIVACCFVCGYCAENIRAEVSEEEHSSRCWVEKGG